MREANVIFNFRAVEQCIAWRGCFLPGKVAEWMQDDLKYTQSGLYRQCIACSVAGQSLVLRPKWWLYPNAYATDVFIVSEN